MKAALFLVPAVVALSLVASATLAGEFRGKRSTRVNMVDGAVFEVVARSSSRGGDYWCGAADFARRGLGLSWSARIFVARTLGPSVTTNRRSAVHFTADPGAAGIAPAERQSLSINAFRAGDNMSVQTAYTYCAMPPTRL